MAKKLSLAFFKKNGSLGGKTSAGNMTEEQRKKRAREAGLARQRKARQQKTVV
jgi:hypothetical protein